jgi:hypothetical protein
MLGLQATVTMDGALEVSATFDRGDSLCGMEMRSLPRIEAAQQFRLRFRAVLTEGGTERLELCVA